MTRFVQKFAAHRLCDTVLINVKPPAWERKGSPEGTRRESEAYLLPPPILCPTYNICCCSVDTVTHVAFVPAASGVGHVLAKADSHMCRGTRYVAHMCPGSHCVGLASYFTFIGHQISFSLLI